MRGATFRAPCGGPGPPPATELGAESYQSPASSAAPSHPAQTEREVIRTDRLRSFHRHEQVGDHPSQEAFGTSLLAFVLVQVRMRLPAAGAVHMVVRTDKLGSLEQRHIVKNLKRSALAGYAAVLEHITAVGDVL